MCKQKLPTYLLTCLLTYLLPLTNTALLVPDKATRALLAANGLGNCSDAAPFYAEQSVVNET